MEVVILQEANEIGGVGADAITALLGRRPAAVLGLATGSSPLAIYDELARRCDAGLISFGQARGFTLDEYVGLPADHPQRYHNVIDEVFVSKVDFAPGAVRGPDGLAADIPERLRRVRGRDPRRGRRRSADPRHRYRRAHRVQRTRLVVGLTNPHQDVDQADPDGQRAPFFGDDVDAVPTHCLTQGLATIMEARHLILVAAGRRKAEAVHQLVEGPISALWPATILQLHPHATVLLDEAAVRRLRLVASTARPTARNRNGRASECF